MTSPSDAEPAASAVALDDGLILLDLRNPVHEKVIGDSGALDSVGAMRIELEIIDGQLFTSDERIVNGGK